MLLRLLSTIFNGPLKPEPSNNLKKNFPYINDWLSSVAEVRSTYSTDWLDKRVVPHYFSDSVTDRDGRNYESFYYPVLTDHHVIYENLEKIEAALEQVNGDFSKIFIHSAFTEFDSPDPNKVNSGVTVTDGIKSKGEGFYLDRLVEKTHLPKIGQYEGSGSLVLIFKINDLQPHQVINLYDLVPFHYVEQLEEKFPDKSFRKEGLTWDDVVRWNQHNFHEFALDNDIHVCMCSSEAVDYTFKAFTRIV